MVSIVSMVSVFAYYYRVDFYSVIIRKLLYYYFYRYEILTILEWNWIIASVESIHKISKQIIIIKLIIYNYVFLLLTNPPIFCQVWLIIRIFVWYLN